MKVVAYCRVSTSDQDCDRQERDLIEFAAKASYELVGVYRETASGAKNDRVERKKILKLAQARKIDAIIVTELSRWGRSSVDLLHTLQDLQSWNTSLIAQSGMSFDLTTPQGKLIAGIMAMLAEFERDLLIERIKSGLANARSKGKQLGRKTGHRPKSSKYEAKVLALVAEKVPYRKISKDLGIAKSTVVEIVKRDRQKNKKTLNG